MSPFTGIALKLASVILFVTMAALIKATTEDVPTGQAIFFRSFFALPVILMWLALRHDLSTGLKTKRPMGHVWRGLIGACGMGFGFSSLAYLPLPDVTAIGFAAPLIGHRESSQLGLQRRGSVNVGDPHDNRLMLTRDRNRAVVVDRRSRHSPMVPGSTTRTR